MPVQIESKTLGRIHRALAAASQLLAGFAAGAIAAEYKAGQDPVTEADKWVDAVLR